MGGIVTNQSKLTSTSTSTNITLLTSKSFFLTNNKILLSKKNLNIHPELRKLRSLLTCEYGRPKFIQYLIRVSSVCHIYEDDNFHNNIDISFLINNLLNKYILPVNIPVYWNDNDEHSNHISYHPLNNNNNNNNNMNNISNVHNFNSNHNSYSNYNNNNNNNNNNINNGHNYESEAKLINSDNSINMILDNCLPQILVLSAISNYQAFLISPEYSDWLKYQQMLIDSRTTSNNNASPKLENSRSFVKTSNTLFHRVENYQITKLLNKPHWIVTLAQSIESLPFPVTILGLETESNHEYKHPYPVLYANLAYIEMVGYSKDEIAQYPYDKYHYTTTTYFDEHNYDPTISNEKILNAITKCKSLHIGVMYTPQTPIQPFLNLQSYIPLYDQDGLCQYIIIVHCDIWKYYNDVNYLHKLDLFTHNLLPKVIPHSDYESTFLQAFYFRDINEFDDNSDQKNPRLSEKYKSNKNILSKNTFNISSMTTSPLAVATDSLPLSDAAITSVIRGEITPI